MSSGEGTRFHEDRPADLRHARPWHRLAYIIRALPEGLAALARTMEVAGDARVLDYGSADAPYRHLFPDTADFVTADLPGNPDADLELRPDGTVPAESESFDVVVSTQVLEHVGDPDTYLSECSRVLRPGGQLLLSTHGMMIYHPDPVDYWRWTCAGLERAVTGHGFEVTRFEGIMGLGATGLQLVQDSVYFRLPRLLAHAVALVTQALIAIADRLEPEHSRRLNALVFALTARKP